MESAAEDIHGGVAELRLAAEMLLKTVETGFSSFPSPCETLCRSPIHPATQPDRSIRLQFNREILGSREMNIDREINRYILDFTKLER